MIFAEKGLPQFAASAAVSSWQEDGLFDESALEDDQKSSLVTALFELRDKVLELSREPKIVRGKAKNDNEISTDEIPDADLEFFVQWVASGGTKITNQVIPFLEGSESSPVASDRVA